MLQSGKTPKLIADESSEDSEYRSEISQTMEKQESISSEILKKNLTMHRTVATKKEELEHFIFGLKYLFEIRLGIIEDMHQKVVEKQKFLNKNQELLNSIRPMFIDFLNSKRESHQLNSDKLLTIFGADVASQSRLNTIVRNVCQAHPRYFPNVECHSDFVSRCRDLMAEHKKLCSPDVDMNILTNERINFLNQEREGKEKIDSIRKQYNDLVQVRDSLIAQLKQKTDEQNVPITPSGRSKSSMKQTPKEIPLPIESPIVPKETPATKPQKTAPKKSPSKEGRGPIPKTPSESISRIPVVQSRSTLRTADEQRPPVSKIPKSSGKSELRSSGGGRGGSPNKTATSSLLKVNTGVSAPGNPPKTRPPRKMQTNT